MPAKRVIILDVGPTTGGDKIAVNWVLWADVPAPVQPFYAREFSGSAYQGISADELAALASGAVAEHRGVTDFPIDATKADMALDGEAEWQAFQDRVNADPRYSYFGSYWDGTAWIGPDGIPIVTDPLSADSILSADMLPRKAAPAPGPPLQPESSHTPFAYVQPQGEPVESEHG